MNKRTYIELSSSHDAQYYVQARKFSVFYSYVIKTKIRNRSMNKVKKLGYDRKLLYKQPRQETRLCCSRVIPRSVTSVSSKCKSFVRKRHVCALRFFGGAGAPNGRFLSNAFKRYFMLSGVL